MALNAKRGVVLVSASILTLSTLCAFAADESAGGRVIPIRPNVDIRQQPSNEAPCIDYTCAVPIWRIQETKADWLKTKDGWIRKVDVIACDKAVEYFTGRIKESPTAYAYAARSHIRYCDDQIDEATKDAETALSMAPDSCDALLVKALLSREAGRTTEAVDCFTRIIQLDPRNKGAYGGYAREFMKIKDRGKIADVMSSALRQWPDDVLFRSIRARACFLRGSQRSEQEDYVAAEEDCSKSIGDWNDVLKRSSSTAEKKSCAEVYAFRGGIRLAANRPEEAVSDFSRALELASDDPQIWFQRGCAHSLNNRHQLAIDDFKAAIQRGSKNANVYAACCQSLIITGQVDEALTILDEWVRLDDRNPTAYATRGNAHIEKAQYTKAVVDFTKALALDPELARCYERRAEAWHKLKEYDKAIADCTSAITLNPQSPYALANRAVSFASKEEFEKAFADCDAAILLDPVNGNAIRTRGSIKALRGDYSPAIEDLTKAISLNPLDGEAYWNRSSVWMSLGNYEKAVSDLTEYLRLSPKSSEGYRARGNAYDVLGNSRQADADEETAKSIEVQRRRR